MMYEIALWTEAEQASAIRFGNPRSENDAAHRAVVMSRELKHSMCIVEVKTGKVVQVIRYYP